VIPSETTVNAVNNDLSKNVETEMNFHGPVTTAIGKATGPIMIDASVRRQDLAEAVGEIQRILVELDVDRPESTDLERVAHVDGVISPTIKDRAVAALKAGGESAVDEFLLQDKYAKIIKSLVKAWLSPPS
jgi:hypothetical protein